jgi:predicted MFS family arabinose efflux permease
LALGISALLLVLNALQEGGRRGYFAIVLGVIALTALSGFVRRERRAAQPIVDLALLRMHDFAAINLASVLVYLTSFSILLFTPFYLVRIAGMPPSAAGAMLAASFAGTIAASPLAGRIVGRVAAGRVALSGAALSAAGLALIGGWSPGMRWPMAMASATLVLQGFGVGLFQVAYMDVVLGSIPRQQRGVAGSLAMLTRTLGIVGGATLLSLLFHAVEGSRLAASAASADAFLAAYRTTFRLAGFAALLAGALALRGGPRAP